MLRAASDGGHDVIVRLLLEHGADVNAQYGRALRAASDGGHDIVVRLLLEHGADMHAQRRRSPTESSKIRSFRRL